MSKAVMTVMLVVSVGLLLAGCGAVTPEVIEKEVQVEVTKEVIVEKEVEVTQEVVVEKRWRSPGRSRSPSPADRSTS